MTHTCPVQGITINVRCPVQSCMWNCQRIESGCLHGHTLIDNDEYLATVKNGGQDIDGEVEDATRRIKCLLILDGFCSHLIGSEVKVPSQHEKLLRRLLESLPQFNRRNGWTTALMYQSLNKKVWYAFKRTLSEEDIIHREVLGLTQKLYKDLQLLLNK